MKYFNTKFFELSNDIYFAINSMNKVIEHGGRCQEVASNNDDFLSLIPSYESAKIESLLNECRKENRASSTLASLIFSNEKTQKGQLEIQYDSYNKNIIACFKISENNSEFLKTIMDNSPYLACYLDHHLNYKYVNKAFESWFEIKSSDYIGKTYDNSGKNALMNSLRSYIDEALNGNKQNIEMITPDLHIAGQYRIMNINMNPDFSGSTCKGIFIFIEDITELRTNAIEAIEKVKKLQTLFDNLSQGVILQDYKSRIIEFNKSALRILGLTKDQLLGKTSYDPYWKIVDEEQNLIKPDEHPAMIAMKSGVAIHNKLLGVYTSSTDIAWISVTAIPLFESEDSKPFKVLVTFEDLTKILKLKQELKAKSTWKTALLNGADDALISTTPEGMIVTFNKKAEELLGYKADELINKFSPVIFHDLEEINLRAVELTKELKEPVAPGFEAFVAKALRYGKDSHEWTYITKKQQKIKINLKVTAIRDDQDKCIGFLGMATKSS